MTTLNIGPIKEPRAPGTLYLDIRPVGDVQGDIRHLDLPPNSFDKVECIAVLEHLERDDAPLALREFWRVLKPGGVLILAVPDMEKCCQTYVAGNDAILLNIYSPSAEPAQHHRWGYRPSALKALLEKEGFVDWHPLPPDDPHGFYAAVHKPEGAK